MSRTATPLNIPTQPGLGMAYVARDVTHRKNVRVATTCQRDLDRRGSGIKVLRQFSGEEPFFTAKVGSLNTQIEVLKFLCGTGHKKCRATAKDGTVYEWTGVSVAQARKDGMEFEEPNYVAKDEAPAQPAKTKKVKAEKNVKAPKAEKVAKGKRGRPRKVVTTVDAGTPAADTTEAAPVEAAAPAAPAQSDAEFEAEIAADFAVDVAKATERNAERSTAAANAPVATEETATAGASA